MAVSFADAVVQSAAIWAAGKRRIKTFPPPRYTRSVLFPFVSPGLTALQAIDFMPEVEELRVFVHDKAAAVEAEKVPTNAINIKGLCICLY